TRSGCGYTRGLDLSRRNNAARWAPRHRRRARADRRGRWRRLRRVNLAGVRRRRADSIRRHAVSSRHRQEGARGRMKYSVITFGCRVNQADSLELEERLLASGAAPATPERADVVVVNTCSVTATSDQGARQTIRRVARDNPSARIVVTG